jgi:uncharacterized protein YecE (DUF72 family)
MVRCGVAGWDYESWKGRVYPERPPSHFDPLRYVGAYFRALEINRTYYRPATVKEANAWLARIRDRPELRLSAKLPEQFVAPGRSWSNADVVEARTGLERIHDQGRLAAAVLQFAYSFKRTRKDGSVDGENVTWLWRAVEAFNGLPVFVEFRHDSWNVPEVLDDLRSRGAGWVNVDQPMLFKNALPLTAHATTSTGYLRMHGRNYQSWGRGLGRKKKSAQTIAERKKVKGEQRVSQEARKDDRFDYLYSPKEVRQLAGIAEQLAATPGVRDVLTINNNHASGKGPVNALMLDAMIRGDQVPAPPELFREFGDVLHDFAFAAPPAPVQEELELHDAHR